MESIWKAFLFMPLWISPHQLPWPQRSEWILDCSSLQLNQNGTADCSFIFNNKKWTRYGNNEAKLKARKNSMEQGPDAPGISGMKTTKSTVLYSTKKKQIWLRIDSRRPVQLLEVGFGSEARKIRIISNLQAPFTIQNQLSTYAVT